MTVTALVIEAFDYMRHRIIALIFAMIPAILELCIIESLRSAHPRITDPISLLNARFAREPLSCVTYNVKFSEKSRGGHNL